MGPHVPCKFGELPSVPCMWQARTRDHMKQSACIKGPMEWKPIESDCWKERGKSHRSDPIL